MLARYTYLKIILAAACLFTTGLYAAEEGSAKVGMGEEGMMDEGMAEEGMAEDEGMLEEEAEELPPLYTSEVEAGVIYSSQDSFKFGEYSGIDEEGFYGLGNILIRKNRAFGDGADNYWELSGTSLGLDSRNIYAEYSHDGTYGEYDTDRAYSFYFEYDQIPHYALDDAETMFLGAGTANQTLPGAYANPGSGTAGIAFNGTLRQVDVETDRETISAGFELMPADGWTITGDFRHQDKDGTETQGISTNRFDNAFFGIIPIDYETNEFGLRITRVGEKGQFELGYHLSLFDNDTRGIMYENPFDNGGNNPLGTQGQMGVMPDNTAHTVTFNGGYSLGQTTRAIANLSYQRMSQDETFLPYTVNPNFIPTAVPLPRNDLDGVIDNWFANITLTGMPTQKLNLTGRYTFDYRDSDTPRNTYQYIQTDARVPDAIDGSHARVNPDYDLEKHKFGLDARYRLMPRASLSAGYEFEFVARNLSEVDQTYEHTGKLKLMGSPTDRTHGWIKYLHADKHGDDYENWALLLSGFSPEHIADVIAGCGGLDLDCPDLYETNSNTRKFYMADRERDQVAGNLSFFPNNKVTLGVTGRYTMDDYDETRIGLTDRDTASVTLDLSYMPRENFTTYAYYTHEHMSNDQVQCEGCDPEPSAALDPDRTWEVSNEDSVNSIGAGLEWMNAIEDKLDITLDFAFTRAITEVDPTVGPNWFDGGPAAVLDFPDIETTIYSLNLRGDYRVNQQTKVRLAYQYQYFSNDDWAFDNVNETTIDRILATGERSPDYNVHLIGLSLIYDF